MCLVQLSSGFKRTSSIKIRAPMYAWSISVQCSYSNSTIYSLLDCHSIGTAPESNDEGNERGRMERKKGASGIGEARALRTGRCGPLVHSQETHGSRL